MEKFAMRLTPGETLIAESLLAIMVVLQRTITARSETYRADLLEPGMNEALEKMNERIRALIVALDEERRDA